MLLQDFVNKYLNKNSEGIRGKIDKLSRFWLSRGWGGGGGGGLGESVKKGKFATKIFFR